MDSSQEASPAHGTRKLASERRVEGNIPRPLPMPDPVLEPDYALRREGRRCRCATGRQEGGKSCGRGTGSRTSPEFCFGECLVLRGPKSWVAFFDIDMADRRTMHSPSSLNTSHTIPHRRGAHHRPKRGAPEDEGGRFVSGRVGADSSRAKGSAGGGGSGSERVCTAGREAPTHTAPTWRYERSEAFTEAEFARLRIGATATNETAMMRCARHLGIMDRRSHPPRTERRPTGRPAKRDPLWNRNPVDFVPL